MNTLKARYFDGKTSRGHDVTVMLTSGKLAVVGHAVMAEFDARGVRRSLRIADTPRWLYLPGGGACVTGDNEAVDRWTMDRRYERILHRWESRAGYAAFAVALVVAALWLLIDRGIPAAAEHIAERIPVGAEETLGRESLAGLQNFALKPTTLPAVRQEEYRRKLAAMAKAANQAVPYRLEFRASPVFGPNAFALPSGIIVMTDELVKSAHHEQEVLGVLAHELGHVRHRHSMRHLLESSAIALVIAGVTGDVASATSFAAAAPALLLNAKFSREFEHEADRYAIDLMRKGGLDPRYLARILDRLEQEHGGKRGTIPTFLSSHPATDERKALAESAAAGSKELVDDPLMVKEAAEEKEKRRKCKKEPNACK
jgi:Zn-dependent protease with chaperone function